MQFPNLTAGLGRVMSDNATTLLTGGGVFGVIGTAVLSYRAGMKGSEALKAQSEKWYADATAYDIESDGAGQFSPNTKWDMIKVQLPQMVIPALLGGATIAAIIMSNRVSAKQAAVLAAAYGLNQKQLEEYKEKVKEVVGVNKEKKVREAIAQDEVNDNPPKGQVLILGEGNVLCYDSLSGRYFQSTADKIGKAENAVNGELYHHQICSLSFFYDEVGLKPTELSDGLGWNMSTSDDSQLKVEVTAVLTEDEKPCLNLGFNMYPKHGYEQKY